MVNYIVTQSYVDAIDSARATLADGINDTSLFAQDKLAREALVLTQQIGDHIRGSLVVLPTVLVTPDEEAEEEDEPLPEPILDNPPKPEEPIPDDDPDPVTEEEDPYFPGIGEGGG